MPNNNLARPNPCHKSDRAQHRRKCLRIQADYTDTQPTLMIWVVYFRIEWQIRGKTDMAANHLLDRLVTPIDRLLKRPNLFNHLIVRLSLGLFGAMLPTFITWFLMSFFFSTRDAAITRLWQLHWTGVLATMFILALLMSMVTALLVHLVSFRRDILLRYGRTGRRVITITMSAYTLAIPYIVIVFHSQRFALPIVIMSCLIPVISFIVLMTAIKHYLLRLRIWYDQQEMTI